MKSKTYSVSMNAAPKKVYDFVSNLENMPEWAKTFCKSIQKTGNEWVMQTNLGPAKIRITPKNDLGVLDHTVYPAPGVEVHVPMRVVANGSGSEVVFTLFQQPGMSDADFLRDQVMVEQDLSSLKGAMEG